MTASWGTPQEPAPAQPGALARQERSVDFWWRAMRRKPLIAVLTVVGIGAPFGLLAVVPDFGFWHYAVVAAWGVIVKQELRVVKERLTRDLEVADETAETDGSRRPIDVRTGETVTPSLDRGTPARHSLNVMTRVAAAITVGSLAVGCWVALGVDDAAPIVVIFGVLSALGVAGLVFVPRGFRRKLAYVTSRPGPVLVRVVGHRPSEGRWVLEALDGEGEIGEVTLSGGGEHLLAGDVVHAWGDVLVEENLPPRKRRLALTGPFGTLLALSVADRRSIEVRMSLDRDARLAEQAAAKEPS